MIRIAITEAAFKAITATLPLGVGYEAEPNQHGERLIWLEDAMADRTRRDAETGGELLGSDLATGRDGDANMRSLIVTIVIACSTWQGFTTCQSPDGYARSGAGWL